MELQLRQPWIKFGTDAGSQDPATAEGMVHPRSYGNFPRIFARYVRERHVLTLEDAVRKASSAVATRLLLTDRGVLKAGLKADVIVFDPATIQDNATFEKPHQLSTGDARRLRERRGGGAQREPYRRQARASSCAARATSAERWSGSGAGARSGSRRVTRAASAAPSLSPSARSGASSRWASVGSSEEQKESRAGSR